MFKREEYFVYWNILWQLKLKRNSCRDIARCWDVWEKIAKCGQQERN